MIGATAYSPEEHEAFLDQRAEALLDMPPLPEYESEADETDEEASEVTLDLDDRTVTEKATRQPSTRAYLGDVMREVRLGLRTPLSVPSVGKVPGLVKKLLYPGLNTVTGDPSSGKTMFGVILAVLEVMLGNRVIVLYAEGYGNPQPFSERLKAVMLEMTGWSDEVVEQVSNEQVLYWDWNDGVVPVDEIADALGNGPKATLVLLDSIPRAMGYKGLDELKSKDVIEFFGNVVYGITAANGTLGALLAVDALPKSHKANRRGAIGSGQKFYGVESSWRMETYLGQPFSGMRCTKDKHDARREGRVIAEITYDVELEPELEAELEGVPAPVPVPVVPPEGGWLGFTLRLPDEAGRKQDAAAKAASAAADLEAAKAAVVALMTTEGHTAPTPGGSIDPNSPEKGWNPAASALPKHPTLKKLHSVPEAITALIDEGVLITESPKGLPSRPSVRVYMPANS